MLLFSDLALLAVTFGLLANSLLPDPHIWALFAGEALGTAAYGFQRPARNALTPQLVGEDQLLAAIAVEDVVFTLARVAGPALAGVLIAGVRPSRRLRHRRRDLRRLAARDLAPARQIPAAPDADRPSLQSIIEGFRHVKRRKVLLGIFVVDTNAMIFGMPRVAVPSLRRRARRRPRRCSGSCTRRLFAGALVASLVSGSMNAIRRQGLAVCVAAGAWGVAIALVGFAQAVVARPRLPRAGRRCRLRQRRAPLEHPPHRDSGLAARPPLGDRARAGRRRARDRERRGGNRRLARGRARPRSSRAASSP